MSKKKSLIAISPFARGEYSGHSIADDDFYFKHLLSSGDRFTFYTSQYSAGRLKKISPEAECHLKVISQFSDSILGQIKNALQIRAPFCSRVVFFGYSERLVLLWYLINIFKFTKLILVATNNISSRRVRVYRRPLRVFFNIISPSLKKLVVHTNFEYQLIKGLSAKTASMCYVKKHHLMAPRNVVRPTDTDILNTVVSYFGPPKHDKPIDPLIELVNACKTNEFVFKVYNTDLSILRARFPGGKLPDNVEVKSGWLDTDDFTAAMVGSDLVMLPHNKEFEGKLSGNLCDCIAYGVPYISGAIEPMSVFRSSEGHIGYVCDFEKSGWAEEFCHHMGKDEVQRLTHSIGKFGKNFTLDHITDDLTKALRVA